MFGYRNDFRYNNCVPDIGHIHPIVPPILIQDKITSSQAENRSAHSLNTNSALKRSKRVPRHSVNRSAATLPKPQAAPPKRPAVDDSTVIELQAYKELLDMGLVTKEEFERKKRELLNL